MCMYRCFWAVDGDTVEDGKSENNDLGGKYIRSRCRNSGFSGILSELKVRVHVRGVRRQSGSAVWKSLEGQTPRLEYVIEWVFPLNTIAMRVHLLSSASIYKLIPRNAFTAEFILRATLSQNLWPKNYDHTFQPKSTVNDSIKCTVSKPTARVDDLHGLELRCAGGFGGDDIEEQRTESVDEKRAML